MNIVTIVGARPQFIKVTLVGKALRKKGHEDFVIHTGQHYDYRMSQAFFDELQIPPPNINLDIGSGLHGWQTGHMLIRLEKFIGERKPDCVIVYGDTNTTLAGALAASKLHVPVAHIEAGLRSYNKSMPEEQNRIVTDHLSSFLFCPTEIAVNNLVREGFSIKNHKGKPNTNSSVVIRVGDVMYDCALFYSKRAEKSPDLLRQLDLIDNRNKIIPFILCTIHRAENTDSITRLCSIFAALNRLNQKIKIVLPLHPRTQRFITQNEMLHRLTQPLTIIKPVSYLEMLLLENHCTLICTDSGGVQKEAYFFKKPCITMRDQTEWVETVDAGWNRLTGADSDQIISACELAMSDPMNKKRPPPFLNLSSQYEHLYGNGNAGELIVDYLTDMFKNN